MSTKTDAISSGAGEVFDAVRMARDLTALVTTAEPEKHAAFQFSGLVDWSHKICPHYFTAPPNEQHEWLAAELLQAAYARGRRIVLEGPRDSAKSAYATTFYPLFGVCEETEPYIVLTGEDSKQAKKYLEHVKAELTGNEQIEEHYPDAFGKGPVWNKTEIVTRNGIRIEAVGAGNRIRGIRKAHVRPTYIVGDDVEGGEAKFSETKRDRRWAWWTEDVMKAGTNRTNYVVVGNRLHQKSVTARLATQPEWRHRLFAAIESWPLRMDLWLEWENVLCDISDAHRSKSAREFYQQHRADMDNGAKVLWPEYKSLYDLMVIRAADGHSAFMAEMQNNPRDPSKCEWPAEYFDPADERLWFSEWPANPLLRIISVDPSKGRTDRASDYQAIIMLAIVNGDIYVDADIERRPMDLFMDAVVAHIRAFQPMECVIESNQFQSLILPFVQQRAIADEILAPLYGKVNTANKVIRVRGTLSPYILHRRIKFMRRSRGIQLLIEQLQDFPDPRAKDDGCFVASTLIWTRRGNVPIEQLTTADEVWTRGGWRRVLAVGCTGQRVVITRLGLTGTANHPIITDSGNKPLAMTCGRDTLTICVNQLLGMDKYITATRTRSKATTEITFKNIATGKSLRTTCIGMSGYFTTDLFRPVTLCTTRMAIPQTTVSKTLRASKKARTSNCTERPIEDTAQRLSDGHLRSPKRPQKAGIVPQPDLPGTASMDVKLGVSGQAQPINVDIANAIMKPSFQVGPSIARQCVTIAPQLVVCESAQYVEFVDGNSSCIVGMTRAKPAGTNARGHSIFNVYNLRVDGAHEYFANGVLVHNCDALAQGIERAAEILAQPDAEAVQRSMEMPEISL